MVSDASFERLECSTTRLDGDGQQLRPGFRRGGGRGPCIVFISLAGRRHIVSSSSNNISHFPARYVFERSSKSANDCIRKTGVAHDHLWLLLLLLLFPTPRDPRAAAAAGESVPTYQIKWRILSVLSGVACDALCRYPSPPPFVVSLITSTHHFHL